MHSVALAALVAAGLAMVLIACGGGGGGGSKDAVGLDEQLGFDRAGILQRQAKVEGSIRDCMKQQGFEYIPVDPAARQAALAGGNLTPEEFEHQFGYGITTLYEQRRQQAAGGPNEKIRAALGATERVAYDRALLGEPGSDTYAAALDNGDFSNLGGCTKKATDEAFGGPGVAESLQTKLDDLDAKIIADQRMQDAIKHWSSCMHAAGFELGAPDEVDTQLKSRLTAIVGSSQQTATASSAAPSYDTAALAALQRDEVTMVAADLKCEEQHLSSAEAKVRTELEQRFREENPDLLSKVPAP
jgi:hypothetical protein